MNTESIAKREQGRKRLAWIAGVVVLATVGVVLGLLLRARGQLAEANEELGYWIDRYCGSFVSDLELATNDYRQQLDAMSAPGLAPEQQQTLQAKFDAGLGYLGSDLSDAGRRGVGLLLQSKFGFCDNVREITEPQHADLGRRFAKALSTFSGGSGTIRDNSDRRRIVDELHDLTTLARELVSFPLRSKRH